MDLPFKRSVDVALSSSLFKKQVPSHDEMFKVMHKTAERKDKASKDLSELTHVMFDSRHAEYTNSQKEKIKQILRQVMNKVTVISNDYYIKSSKLIAQKKANEISTESYEMQNTLALTNTYLAEAVVYEDAVGKISEMTGTLPTVKPSTKSKSEMKRESPGKMSKSTFNQNMDVRTLESICTRQWDELDGLMKQRGALELKLEMNKAYLGDSAKKKYDEITKRYGSYLKREAKMQADVASNLKIAKANRYNHEKRMKNEYLIVCEFQKNEIELNKKAIEELKKLVQSKTRSSSKKCRI
jgi:hypothetical protein